MGTRVRGKVRTTNPGNSGGVTMAGEVNQGSSRMRLGSRDEAGLAEDGGRSGTKVYGTRRDLEEKGG